MRRLKKVTKEKTQGNNCCSDDARRCCAAVPNSGEATKEAVRKNYGDLIKSAREGACCTGAGTAAQLAGYTEEQLAGLPPEMRQTIFACGNPVAFAEIEEGQAVLDIGSGAGLDALLAAKKVGPEGKVIGLDMTSEMIEAARANAEAAGGVSSVRVSAVKPAREE